VFIVGAHRCGTSMTLQAFHEGDYSVAYEQVDGRAFHNQLLRNDEEIRALLNRCRADVAAFKPLRQNQHVRKYLAAFPTLQVVWLVRDYRRAAVSAAAQWSSIHASLERMANNEDSHDWRSDGMTANQRTVIQSLYRPDLSLISAYALFWYLRSSFYFEHELQNEDRVRLFFYEDLIARPRLEFHRMMTFCQCRFDEKCYRHIRPREMADLTELRIDEPIAQLCDQFLRRMIVQKLEQQHTTDGRQIAAECTI
jgi:hypothetical protein